MKFVPPIESLYLHILSLAEENATAPLLLQCDTNGISEKAYSRDEFRRSIEAVAQWFLSEGLKEGDVIGLGLSNSLELLIISWAAWSIGIVTVPLDIKRDTVKEHTYKLSLTKAKVVLFQEELLTKQELHAFQNIKIIFVSDIPFEKKSDIAVPWKKNLDYLVLILFTSGTTSHPKGVKLTLQNLIANADGIREWFGIFDADRFMVVLPLHHINSTTFCLATLLGGASIAVVPTYSNSRFWKQIANTGATFTSIVQSICFDQLSKVEEYQQVKDALKLTRIQIGSAPVVVSDAKEFIKRFFIPLYQGYGQTETALRVTGVPLDLEKSLYEKLLSENSIGIPMKWVEAEIMGEDGEILGEEKEGELVVKGPIIMQGYIGTDEGFRNGYFLTGDIGFFQMIDGKRFFFLKGRKKEIIIKGGINISPVAVENKVKQLSAAIDQVFVIGVEDHRYGEELAAVICWKDDVDIEKEKLLLKGILLAGTSLLSTYETPQYLTSLDSKDLPMTSTGKVQRSVLKNTVYYEQLELIYLIAQTSEYRYVILSQTSPYLKDAFELYNICWDPLTVSLEEFKSFVKNITVIAAVDQENKTQGLVCVERTSLSPEQIGALQYKDLLDFKAKKVIDPSGDSFICVAICGSNYKPEQVTRVDKKPSVGEIKAYIESGKENVFEFHRKAKGGLSEGAKLIAVLPDGRPEDERALGYNMLLRYPVLDQDIKINEHASVATQLIEVVMYFGRALGVKNIYAFSRPAGAAKHFSNS